jgi:hypothetical protein
MDSSWFHGYAATANTAGNNGFMCGYAARYEELTYHQMWIILVLAVVLIARNFFLSCILADLLLHSLNLQLHPCRVAA